MAGATRKLILYGIGWTAAAALIAVCLEAYMDPALALSLMMTGLLCL